MTFSISCSELLPFSICKLDTAVFVRVCGSIWANLFYLLPDFLFDQNLLLPI